MIKVVVENIRKSISLGFRMLKVIERLKKIILIKYL